MVSNARIRGRINRDNGKEFESIILAACDRYRAEGIADIDKTPEPMSVVQNLGKGKFVAYFAKKAQPDFQGTLAGSGRSICFEAKHTSSDRIEKSAVSSEQEKVLDIKYKMGAECFVLVSFQFMRYYKVPWEIWKDMKNQFGHQYMSETDGAPYLLKHSAGPYIKFLCES